MKRKKVIPVADLKLLQGNEACALGAIHGGVRFYAGYPITPSTEIAEIMAEELPKYGGKFIQMEDEIASMAAIIGASLTGVKTLTATSGPGFSLKQENIGYAAITEVPCVIVNVQRGGPSTGLPTSPAQGEIYQSKYGSHGDRGVIVLTPGSVPECFRLGVRAVSLAEKYMTPVVLLTDEVVGHMREAIDLEEMRKLPTYDRKKPQCRPEEYIPYAPDENGAPVLAPFGTGYRYHVTGLTHDQAGFSTMAPDKVEELNWRLINKIEDNSDDIVEWEEVYTEDAESLILSYGGSARAAREAVEMLRAKGQKVGLFRPISIWPFPEKALQALASKVSSILVVEMNAGQLGHEVERVVAGKTKVDGLYVIDGEIMTPDEIINKWQEVAK
ncbi:MAG: 2-oxoacid:acceptor oxidoreductase subunit alpha [Bacillota bacterium]|nr:2-oxoacid:acceptor oxidoreductase subunit alpha [Bacillota bacterium]